MPALSIFRRARLSKEKQLSMSVPIVLLLLIGTTWPRLAAQTCEFEASTIKLSEAAEHPSIRGGPGTPSPGEFFCTRTPLSYLVTRAWGFKNYALDGPASMHDTYYDIAAKGAAGTGADEFNCMLQTLLTRSLALVLRRESRRVVVYDLAVAKGGLKMHPAEPAPANGRAPNVKFIRERDGTLRLPPGRRGLYLGATATETVIAARMQNTSAIANTLAALLGHPVIDKSSLKQEYDYKLHFARDSSI